MYQLNLFDLNENIINIIYIMVSYDISPASGFPNMYDSINGQVSKYGHNVTVLLVLTFIIVGYYLVFKHLGTTPNIPTTGSSGIQYIEILMWGTLIFLVLINGLQYFFSIDVKTAIKDIFSNDMPIVSKMRSIRGTSRLLS